MTREELKRAFAICLDTHGCTGCPLLALEQQNGCDCRHNLFVSAIDIATKQEREIEQLKEECEQLRDEKWDAQDDLDCYCDEMTTRINKAVQDFAEKLKAKLNAIFGKTICSDLDTEDITDIIDEFIKEIEKQ